MAPIHHRRHQGAHKGKRHHSTQNRQTSRSKTRRYRRTPGTKEKVEKHARMDRQRRSENWIAEHQSTRDQWKGVAAIRTPYKPRTYELNDTRGKPVALKKQAKAMAEYLSTKHWGYNKKRGRTHRQNQQRTHQQKTSEIPRSSHHSTTRRTHTTRIQGKQGARAGLSGGGTIQGIADGGAPGHHRPSQ